MTPEKAKKKRDRAEEEFIATYVKRVQAYEALVFGYFPEFERARLEKEYMQAQKKHAEAEEIFLAAIKEMTLWSHPL